MSKASVMPVYRRHSAKRREGGVSLIEALVSLVILALGILGLAGLQTRTLIESRNTNYRGIAIQMISDLSERMQMNPTAARTGAYSALAFGAAPAPVANCLPANTAAAGVSCTPAQLAASDLAQWRAELLQIIPNADVSTFPNLQNGTPVIGVIVAWPPQLTADTDNAASSAALTFAPNANGVACPAGLICHFGWISLP